MSEGIVLIHFEVLKLAWLYLLTDFDGHAVKKYQSGNYHGNYFSYFINSLGMICYCG